MSDTSFDQTEERLSLGALIQNAGDIAESMEDGKEPCPECGKLYIPGAGMTRHRITAHGIQPKNQTRVTCKEPGCNARFHKNNIGRHMREVHGIRGGVSGKVRRTPAEMKKKNGPKPKLDKVAMLLNQPTAEEIVSTAAEMLWVDSVPTHYMGALMKWYQHTAEFLNEVRNGTE